MVQYQNDSKVRANTAPHHVINGRRWQVFLSGRPERDKRWNNTNLKTKDETEDECILVFLVFSHLRSGLRGGLSLQEEYETKTKKNSIFILTKLHFKLNVTDNRVIRNHIQKYLPACRGTHVNDNQSFNNFAVNSC